MTPNVPSLGGPSGPRQGRPPGVDEDLTKPVNGNALETAPPAGQPWLGFDVAGVRAVEHAAVPTLVFDLEVDDQSDREVFAVALTIQIMLEPVKRGYDDATRARLIELFGEPGRWATTARQMMWTTQSVMVNAFRGKTNVDIPVHCSYDLELAATKYFSELPDGEVPLVMHFNGSVYYSDPGGRLQVIQIPWDTVAEYRMPVAVWRQMINLHYPYRTWVPVSHETLDRLGEVKAERGRHTFDDTIADLIDESDRGEEGT